jgi:hypothetical protein
MKLIADALPVLLVLLLAGCQSNQTRETPDDRPADTGNAPTPAETTGPAVVERWKLTRVVQPSMIAGKADTSSAPPYQETIELRADSTFRRTRSNGYEATGKYTTRRFGPDDQGILATFDDPKLSYHELSGTRQNSPRKARCTCGNRARRAGGELRGRRRPGLLLREGEGAGVRKKMGKLRPCVK